MTLSTAYRNNKSHDTSIAEGTTSLLVTLSNDVKVPINAEKVTSLQVKSALLRQSTLSLRESK